MEDVTTNMLNFAIVLASGIASTLLVQMIWQELCERGSSKPKPPVRSLAYVLVEAEYAGRFMQANPQMMSADQTQVMLRTFPVNPERWLDEFTDLVAAASLKDASKIPLFYVRRG